MYICSHIYTVMYLLMVGLNATDLRTLCDVIHLFSGTIKTYGQHFLFNDRKMDFINCHVNENI